MRWRGIIALVSVWLWGAVCSADVDPFADARPGFTPVPVVPAFPLPSNAPQLSVARPYAVFLPDADRPSDIRTKPESDAATDWYRYWTFALPSRPPGMNRSAWAESVRTEVEGLRSAGDIRGSVICTGTPEDVLASGSAADYLGITLKPRVTGDAAINRYGLGFVLRLAADICERIPLPTLDLSDARPGDAAWVRWWLDEAVRNGIAGLTLRTPEDKQTTDLIRNDIEKLRGPNVYLPPLSEVAVLLPIEALGTRPTEWNSVFRMYSGLRASGVWPNFVSDEAVASGTVSLARYKVIIAPRNLSDESPAYRKARDAARRGAVLMACKDAALKKTDRVLARKYNGKPAMTRRDIGFGCIIYAAVEPWSLDGGWHGFWQGIFKEAGVPVRPWLEAVTVANAGIITGKYSRPR